MRKQQPPNVAQDDGGALLQMQQEVVVKTRRKRSRRGQTRARHCRPGQSVPSVDAEGLFEIMTDALLCTRSVFEVLGLELGLSKQRWCRRPGR